MDFMNGNFHFEILETCVLKMLNRHFSFFAEIQNNELAYKSLKSVFLKHFKMLFRSFFETFQNVVPQ